MYGQHHRHTTPRQPACRSASRHLVDTLESFLSKVAFESNLRKKLSTIEHVLIVKVSFERRKIAKVSMTHVQVFFRKSLSKEILPMCHENFGIFLFFQNKLSRLEHVLFLKVSFASYFRKRLSKENFLVCHYLKVRA